MTEWTKSLVNMSLSELYDAQKVGQSFQNTLLSYSVNAGAADDMFRRSVIERINQGGFDGKVLNFLLTGSKAFQHTFSEFLLPFKGIFSYSN